MVFRCPVHKEQSIDDVCPECDFQGKAPKLHRMRTDKRYFKKNTQYLALMNDYWYLMWFREGELTDDDEMVSCSVNYPSEIYEIQDG